MTGHLQYQAIVLGASAGGMKLIRELVTGLPQGFSLPIVIVQHIADSLESSWHQVLDQYSNVRVKEADEKEPIEGGTVYVAPPNYHLLVETDRTFTLTVDERVNYARPSIDVLFETAAEAYGAGLVGIVCTGGNFDGAQGLLYIKQRGGYTIAQDPATADTPAMPQAAIRIGGADHVMTPEAIAEFLLTLHKNQLHPHESKS